MTTELSKFAARLRETISFGGHCFVNAPISQGSDEALPSKFQDLTFDTLALELFALQFKYNAAYRKICEARRLTPQVVEHWTQIPAVPTAAFKELELTSLVPEERTAVFHSSGTTDPKPSRHFHNAESLAVYEASLWPWFQKNVLSNCGSRIADCGLVILTPPPPQAPHSSLVHMFETIRRKLGGASVLASRSPFFGKVAADGSWTLDFDALVSALSPQAPCPAPRALLLLGTAFSFVHLLDYLTERNLRFDLPAGSRVMETGGYKNRSRSMSKTELHRFITGKLGIPSSRIICEYGMSEMSSQAYDSAFHLPSSIIHHRVFQFPPWARVQIISPETGREVADGETGLIRVFDLANVFSVMAVQTEDLGIRRDGHFELIGRAALAEPRGCSLMMLEGSASSLPQSKWGIDKAMPSKK